MCSAYDARISHTLAGHVLIKQLICLRESPDFRIRMIALSLQITHVNKAIYDPCHAVLWQYLIKRQE
jgi:hypothetical protein